MSAGTPGGSPFKLPFELPGKVDWFGTKDKEDGVGGSSGHKRGGESTTASGGFSLPWKASLSPSKLFGDPRPEVLATENPAHKEEQSEQLQPPARNSADSSRHTRGVSANGENGAAHHDSGWGNWWRDTFTQPEQPAGTMNGLKQEPTSSSNVVAKSAPDAWYPMVLDGHESANNGVARASSRQMQPQKQEKEERSFPREVGDPEYSKLDAVRYVLEFSSAACVVRAALSCV